MFERVKIPNKLGFKSPMKMLKGKPPSYRYIIENSGQNEKSRKQYSVRKNSGSSLNESTNVYSKVNAVPSGWFSSNSPIIITKPSKINMEKWSNYTKQGIKTLGSPIGYITGEAADLGYKTAKGITGAIVGTSLQGLNYALGTSMKKHSNKLVNSAEKYGSNIKKSLKTATASALNTSKKTKMGLRGGRKTRRNRFQKYH